MVLVHGHRHDGVFLYPACNGSIASVEPYGVEARTCGTFGRMQHVLGSVFLRVVRTGGHGLRYHHHGRLRRGLAGHRDGILVRSHRGTEIAPHIVKEIAMQSDVEKVDWGPVFSKAYSDMLYGFAFWMLLPWSVLLFLGTDATTLYPKWEDEITTFVVISFTASFFFIAASIMKKMLSGVAGGALIAGFLYLWITKYVHTDYVSFMAWCGISLAAIATVFAFLRVRKEMKILRALPLQD